MSSIKISIWNAEWMAYIFEENSEKIRTTYSSKGISDIDSWAQKKANLIKNLQSDLIGIVEGPKLLRQMKKFVKKYLVDANGNPLFDVYRTKDGYGFNQTWDIQYIYLLVTKQKSIDIDMLVNTSIVDQMLYEKWKGYYWGSDSSFTYRSARRPLVADVTLSGNKKFRIIICHSKSKRTGLYPSAFNTNKRKYIEESLKARVKLSTEIYKMRNYLDHSLSENDSVPIVLMGDFNDGPGREYFERNYLFHDPVNILLGKLLHPKQHMYHTLSNYNDDKRYTAYFESIPEFEDPPEILLDHILVSTDLLKRNSSIKLIKSESKVEHSVYDNLIDDENGNISTRPSDHRPASIVLRY